MAQSTGYSRPWIRAIATRDTTQGAASIGDGRQRNLGHAPLLHTAPHAARVPAVEGPSPEGGRWSAPQVAACIAQVVDHPVSAQRGGAYLRRLGVTPRVPRPRHAKADPAVQDAFQGGGLEAAVKAIQVAHRAAQVAVWTSDEHRIGLKPILRRVWARRGQRVRALVHHRSPWMYGVAVVWPQIGQTHWWLLPTVTLAVCEAVGAACAQTVGAGPQRQVVVVLDRADWRARRPDPGAGWHARQHLVRLPPSSPA